MKSSKRTPSQKSKPEKLSTLYIRGVSETLIKEMAKANSRLISRSGTVMGKNDFYLHLLERGIHSL